MKLAVNKFNMSVSVALSLHEMVNEGNHRETDKWERKPPVDIFFQYDNYRDKDQYEFLEKLGIIELTREVRNITKDEEIAKLLKENKDHAAIMKANKKLAIEAFCSTEKEQSYLGAEYHKYCSARCAIYVNNRTIEHFKKEYPKDVTYWVLTVTELGLSLLKDNMVQVRLGA